MAKQYRLGRHQDTSRKKYSKEENKKAIISYLKGKKDILGFCKWMHQYQKDLRVFDVKENQHANQVGSILKTGKLFEVKLEKIERKLRQLRLQPDYTTLASRVDSYNTTRSYTQEVTVKVDVDVNVNEEVPNEETVAENNELTQWLKEILTEKGDYYIPSL